MIKQSFYLCFFLAITLISSQGVAEPTNTSIGFSISNGKIYFTDKYNALDSMKRAQLTHLASIADNKSIDGFEQNFARAASYRATYKISRSNAEFRGCEKSIRNLDSINRTLCSMMLAGGYFIQRDMRSWLAQVNYINQVYDPIINGYFPGRDLEFNSVPGVGKFDANSWPKYYVHFGKSSFFVNYIGRKKLNGYEKKLKTVVPIKINGHTYHALIDTGSSFDVIKSGLAKKLGIKPMVGYGGVTNADVKKMVSSMGVIQSIQLGSFYASNWPVSIINDVPFDVILGLPFLSKIGRIKFEESRLFIGANEGEHRCHSDIRFGSNISGSKTKLLTPLTVSGVKSFAYIDTGTPVFLEGILANKGGGKPDKIIKTLYADGSIHLKKVYSKKGIINIAGFSRRVSYWEEYSRANVSPYVLGSGILSDFSLTVDFNRGKLCLVKSGTNHGFD